MFRNNLTSLSFDDGPGDSTRGILELLAENQAVATFFMIGHEMAGREEVVREVARAGHEIGNHGFAHQTFDRFPDEAAIEQDLADASSEIERLTGNRPRLARARGGMGGSVIGPCASRLNMRLIRWTANANDTVLKDPSAIAALVIERAIPGAVVVLHDQERTLVALRTILPALSGYQLVSVSGLISQNRKTRRKVTAWPPSTRRRARLYLRRAVSQH